MSTNPNEFATDEHPQSQTPGPAGQEREEGGTWGRAIGLDDDADLRFDGRGGWQRVNDSDAVVQDLKVSMLTPEGEDPLRADYGRNLFRLLGRSLPMMETEIRRVMRYDPRVRRVADVDITYAAPNDRENVDVSVTVELADGSIRSFQFPVRNRTR